MPWWIPKRCGNLNVGRLQRTMIYKHIFHKKTKESMFAKWPRWRNDISLYNEVQKHPSPLYDLRCRQSSLVVHKKENFHPDAKTATFRLLFPLVSSILRLHAIGKPLFQQSWQFERAERCFRRRIVFVRYSVFEPLLLESFRDYLRFFSSVLKTKSSKTVFYRKASWVLRHGLLRHLDELVGPWWPPHLYDLGY